MLVLPILVVPFLTLGFWALGGGKGSTPVNKVNTKGLNLQLPEANLKDDESMDKLAFYDKAEKDSLKMVEYMRSDPYYKDDGESLAQPGNQLGQITDMAASKFNLPLNTSPYDGGRANPEKQLMDKLAMLEKELVKPTDEVNEKQVDTFRDKDPELAVQVDRLESMMQMMSNGTGEDPEMKQLDGTLDKILDIQHPERFNDRLQKASPESKGIVYTIHREPREPKISLLDTLKKTPDAGSGFYGLNDESISPADNEAIAAVVHENQILVNGAVIKLRLLDDVIVNSSVIPKGTFVYGIVFLNDERLRVEINSIRRNYSLFPVKLEVHDMDGLTGIYIPGAITRDVAKQSADNSLQLMELSSMNPTLKAQATAAGIGAAKNLFSKKVKLIKVMVKAGYKVLLKVRN